MRDTILVVDDVPELCELIQLYLVQVFGWRVLTANGVEAATEALRTEISRVAAVISDDKMGGFGKNGSDLYFQRSVDLEIHSIPFILMSGTSDANFIETAESFGMHPIGKPFRLPELAAFLHGFVQTPVRKGLVPSGEL